MKDDCDSPLFYNSASRAKTLKFKLEKRRLQIPQHIAIIDPDI